MSSLLSKLLSFDPGAGGRDDTHDFAPGLLGIQAAPPSPLPRFMLQALIALFVLLLLWAAIGRVDIIASADGKLVPQTFLKIVQPSDAGVVKEILVREGDRVEAGQVLLRMDAELSAADTESLRLQIAQKRLQLRRAEAEIAGRPLIAAKDDPPDLFEQARAQHRAHRQAYEDALAQELAVLAKSKADLASALEVKGKLEQTLPVYRAQEEAYQKLGREGYAGNIMVLDKQRERIEKEQDLRAQEYAVASLNQTIAQSEKRLAQITSNYLQQLHNERVETAAQLDKLHQDWAKQEHKNALLELRAPQAGIVKDLATHTPGTVVQPGTILVTVVPRDEALLAEVWVKNEDAGFVREGQRAKVKLATYPFQKYGMLDGTVLKLSADSSDKAADSGANGASRDPSGDANPAAFAYKALVSLSAQELVADGERLELAPGMRVVAEVHQGSRTVLEYLLSPVQKVTREAGRER